MSKEKFDNIQEVAAPVSTKSEYIFVTIPETDMYDAPYPTIQLNRTKFEPGRTYKVPTEIGNEVVDRMKKFEKECVRLLRPKADIKSLNQVNKGSAWSTNSFGAERGMPFGSSDRVLTDEAVVTVNSL
jgi:hypothetical protein